MKTVTSIDFLSNGRLMLGVGSGWNQREMEALGYGFTNRGERMNEMLTVLRGLQGASVGAFTGRQIQVPEGIRMSPSPPEGRSIPLYIGGSGASRVSLERTLKFGDGWMPYGTVGTYDADALRAGMSYLQAERSRAGAASLDTIFKLGVTGHADPGLESSVRELAEIGFDEIIVQGIWDAGIEQGVASIERVRTVLDA
jgi:alkanesulfonate monooxygenase SsuD/methylene tetrahydromethanopterin reductase-like flavin-dependent oxidoreductase (luciferase family)